MASCELDYFNYSPQEINCDKPDPFDSTLLDWSNLRDKNDNFELESTVGELQSRNVQQRACRTCLSMIDDDSYVAVDSLECVSLCLPQVNMCLTKAPVLCHKCSKALIDFYTFTEKCMQVEKDLVLYCNVNNIVGPFDISDYIKRDEDVKCVDVKEENCISPENAKEIEDDVLSSDVEVKSETLDPDFTLKQPTTKRTRKTPSRKAKEHLKADLPIKCETCGEKLSSKWALHQHASEHSGKDTSLKCEICGVQFKYEHSFVRHWNIHLSGAPISKPFGCDCGKYFNRKSKLKKHQETHIEKNKPFICSSCGKRFIDEKQLESHVERVHMNEKAFGCELCGNKYTSKAGLDVHFKSHFPSDKPRPEPGLMCDICGKRFYKKYNLKKHHMSHTGNKPHKCEQCGMKFKERYQLTIHVRKHTGEKPFNCEVCGFKFSSKNRLSVHMRIHTGVKPFSCQFCEMAFTRNDHLVKHMRAIHTGERPFECDVCNKTFNRKDYLLKHKRVHFKASS